MIIQIKWKLFNSNSISAYKRREKQTKYKYLSTSIKCLSLWTRIFVFILLNCTIKVPKCMPTVAILNNTSAGLYKAVFTVWCHDLTYCNGLFTNTYDVILFYWSDELFAKFETCTNIKRH